MTLAGTSAVVFGGTGGLGAGAVRALAAAGAHVLVADLARERAASLAEEVGGTAAYVDVADSETVQAALSTVPQPLRTVVVAHGGSGVAERIVDRSGTPAPLEHFTATVDSYLSGTYNCLRLAAAALAAVEPQDDDGCRGVVVTTASIAAYEGQIGQAAYAAAKGGVVSLTLAAARDLAAVGVRVCCVAPGTILTPAMASVGEEALASFGASVPFPKRLGRPDEYGALVAHIAENTYLNGEVIRLDGAQRFGPR